jgi:hypothetical protein
VVHAGYVGPQVNTTLTALALPEEAMAALAATFSAHQAALGLAPALPESYTLIILGVALLGAAAVIAAFAPETGAWILLFKVAIALGVAAIAVGITEALVGPTLNSTTCNTGSTSCCSQWSTILGEDTTCVDCTNTQAGCTTTVVPGTPSLGVDLLWVAVGLGAVAAVLLGGYLGYRYVTNRPKPGFGSAAPLRQTYRIPFTRPPPPSTPASPPPPALPPPRGVTPRIGGLSMSSP